MVPYTRYGAGYQLAKLAYNYRKPLYEGARYIGGHVKRRFDDYITKGRADRYGKRVMKTVKSEGGGRGVPYDSAPDFHGRGYMSRSKRFGRKRKGRKIVKRRNRKRVKRRIRKPNFLRNGVTYKRELSGGISDLDIVYIESTPVGLDEFFQIAYAAVLRKLFQMAGMSVHTYAGLVSEYSGFVVRQISREAATPRLVEVSAGTFTSLATFETVMLAGFDWFRTYAAGANGINDNANLNRPYKLIFQLVNDDVALGNQYTTKSEILLDDVILHVNAYSKLSFQNRTVASDGSADSDQVSNHPIRGRYYEFNGLPRPKYNQLSLVGVNSSTPNTMFTVINNVGIKSFTPTTNLAGFRGLDDEYKTLPESKLFHNCRRTQAFDLQPGEIKDQVLTWRKSGSLMNLLKRCRSEEGGGSVSYATNFTVWPSNLFAFEEVLNDPTQTVSVFFQENRRLQFEAMIYKKDFFQPHYSTQIISAGP